MKRGLFRLLKICLAVVGVVFCAGSLLAQDPPVSPFNYQVEYAYYPPETGATGRLAGVAKVNGELIIVGYYGPEASQYRGFVYFHETNSFVDMPTLLQLDENVWIRSYCTEVSSNGLVTGAVTDINGRLHGCWFDLLATNPTLHFLEDDFPEIVDGNNTNARALNSNGEILVDNGWVVNINDGTSQQLPTEITIYIDINELGTVLGRGANGIIRYNIHNHFLDPIDGIFDAQDINNLDEFCGFVGIDTVCRGNSNNCNTQEHAYRYGDGPDFDWLSDPALNPNKFIRGESLNDAGDVVGELQGEPSGFDDSVFHYSQRDANGNEAGTSYTVRNLVDDPYLDGATLWQMKVTERDTSLSTPAPIIVGKARFTTEDEVRIFILIPKPSISVTPATGLFTTEGGGSDTFNVVLTGEPTGDVTLGISSSNTDEGTVDQTRLTFTPTDWYIPQTVTVTGVDDAIEDGNVAFTIVTAAATSADPTYNGLDPSDVGVINQDDEQPPVFTYTNNTASPIPDPGTRISTIVVNDSFLVADVNVSVNIDHNRAQDLDVFLVAPNGTRIELFTDVGGNGDDFVNTTLDAQATTSITQGSAPFTGSFRPEGVLGNLNALSTQGSWKLELTDDSSTGGQNAAGVLLGWTLTIEAQ